MDVTERAQEYLRDRVDPGAIYVLGVELLIELHYPTGWAGFQADVLAAENTC